MTRLAIALAVALCASLWFLWDAWQDKDAAEAEAALYARQIAQARVAEGVARVQLELERDRSRQLADAIEEINGGPDAPLPDHIRAVLDGLRTD